MFYTIIKQIFDIFSTEEIKSIKSDELDEVDDVGLIRQKNVANDGIISHLGAYNIYGNAIRCYKCDSLYHVQKNCYE